MNDAERLIEGVQKSLPPDTDFRIWEMEDDCVRFGMKNDRKKDNQCWILQEEDRDRNLYLFAMFLYSKKKFRQIAREIINGQT